MGLHICAVVPNTTDKRGEFVEIANDSTTRLPLTGLELTDYTGMQQRPHIYRFPALMSGAPLHLGAGKSVYVFTGPGNNVILDDGDVLLFAGRNAAVWNNTGDVAYLRRSDGTFIDTMTIGHPKRHPNGH